MSAAYVLMVNDGVIAVYLDEAAADAEAERLNGIERARIAAEERQKWPSGTPRSYYHVNRADYRGDAPALVDDGVRYHIAIANDDGTPSSTCRGIGWTREYAGAMARQCTTYGVAYIVVRD